MTDHGDQFRFGLRRRILPAASVVVIGLLAVGAFLFLARRIPLPTVPLPMADLQAAAIGERIYLFGVQHDRAISPPKETRWMKTVEGDRIQGESEVKPFYSLVGFSDRLWFLNPGMYRVFDGKEWQRFEAPWVGADPIAAATPAQVWVLSRSGEGYSLTSYSHDVWNRPISITVEPNDRERFCADICPSGMVVFKEKIYAYWLKDGHLYQWVFDGDRFGSVEPLREVFGNVMSFEVLADPDRIFVWYLPASAAAPPDRIPSRVSIGLKTFDGNGWREEKGLDRSAPVGLFEMVPLKAQGKTHLLINTGVRIEDLIWEQEDSGRSVFLLGGDLGPSVIRYHGIILLLLSVMVTVAALGSSSVLNRLKPAHENPDVLYASVGRRFTAKGIDTALVIAPVGIMVWARLDPDSLLFPISLAQAISTGGKGLMIMPVLLFTYHVLAEGFWGQTLGKRLCRIIVMNQDLKPCTMLQSVVRNLLRLADGIFLYSVGLMSIAATDRWQRLGDLSGRTVVVRIKT
ncbi:MAG: RDD family protein [Nitrospirae bacterium]|nr:RDD family protein [Nitrospirota bacterium]